MDTVVNYEIPQVEVCSSSENNKRLINTTENQPLK